MAELIRMGGLELRFLQSAETGASLDMFEMTLQPDARMPVPHHHESWEETVYGLTGTSTWRVDGRDVDVPPGGPCLHPARGRPRLREPQRRGGELASAC